jgi:hypothetical protein
LNTTDGSVVLPSGCTPPTTILSDCVYGTDGQSPSALAALWHADGLKVVPSITDGTGNGGDDTGAFNLISSTTLGSNFAAAMVSIAETNGYDGYNLDWYLGPGVDNSKADAFVAFVNTFGKALAAQQMTLSLSIVTANVNGCTGDGSGGAFVDLAKLSASSIDAIILKDFAGALGTASTSCQSVVPNPTTPIACPTDFTGQLNLLCSNLPLGKTVVGLQDVSAATNAIVGTAFSAVQNYGFGAVAVQPPGGAVTLLDDSGVAPPTADWYTLLAAFLLP